MEAYCHSVLRFGPKSYLYFCNPYPLRPGNLPGTYRELTGNLLGTYRGLTGTFPGT